MEHPIAMEPEIGVLAFDFVTFDDLSYPGKHIDNMDFGRDPLVELFRELSDYFRRRHRGSLLPDETQAAL
jgi:hypothetical protein